MSNSGKERRESEPEATSVAEASRGELFDETLSIGGAFQADVSVLDNVALELVIGTGRTKGKREFLVPYFDVEIDGRFFPKIIRYLADDEAQADTQAPDETDEDPRASVSVTVTFDNVAFILERVSKRYRKLTKTLIGISGGELGPVPGRVAYAVDSLRSASAALAAAANNLETSLLQKQYIAFDEATGEPDQTE